MIMTIVKLSSHTTPQLGNMSIMGFSLGTVPSTVIHTKQEAKAWQEKATKYIKKCDRIKNAVYAKTSFVVMSFGIG